jgi:L-amino acid N-acyltransferase YncA
MEPPTPCKECSPGLQPGQPSSSDRLLTSVHNYVIRPATIDDCPQIMEIYNHYVRTSTCTYQEEEDTLPEREAWFQEHGERHPIYVAEAIGSVAAWASLSPFKTRSAYRFTVEDSIYVHQKHLGQGLGKRLLAHLISTARQLGHQQLMGLISSDQAPSVRLHEAFGFQRVGHLPEVGVKFGRKLSLELWQLAL